jgi:RHS repeat-associated protein
MGCKRLNTDFFNFLEIVHSKKSAPEEKKRINYYPFGLKLDGYIYNTVVGVQNNYKYNGKELQNEVINDKKLQWYDYGARNYDPSLGRFFNVDPLGGSSSQIDKSLYAYAWNNPINMIDPDGMHADCNDPGFSSEFDSAGNWTGGDRFDDPYGTGMDNSATTAGTSPMDPVTEQLNNQLKRSKKKRKNKSTSTVSPDGEPSFDTTGRTLLPEIVVKSAKSAIRDIYISILGTKFYDDYYPSRNIKPATMRQSDYNWANAWSDSDNFLANFSYSLSNDIYVTAQTLNPFDGQLTNIDGSGIVRGSSQHLDNGVNTLTTITPFVRGAALGGQTLKGLGYINRLNASQFSYTFKGNLARLSSKARGLTNRIFNKGIDFYNNQISGGMILFKLK